MTLGNHDLGLFYFSGHGVECNNTNYLYPIDGKDSDNDKIRRTCIDLKFILDAKSALTDSSQNLIIILDACRSQISRGLTRQAMCIAYDHPVGTYIAFSTSSNSVADDGERGDGLYTNALLENIDQTNIKIEDLFKKVRSRVIEYSSGNQIPWEHSCLINDVYIAGADSIDVIIDGDYAEIAQSQYKNKDYKLALKYWELALKNDPEHDDYLVGISETLTELRKFKDAIFFAKKACDLHASPSNIYNMSHVCFMADNVDEALKYIDIAISLEPKNIHYHSSKSTICASKGELDQAISHAEYASEMDPSNNMALSQLTELYERNNKLEAALNGAQILIARESGNRYFQLQYERIVKKYDQAQLVRRS